jgi:hypothetical protein
MSKGKYRIVQTAIFTYEVQEYIYVDHDIRSGEAVYNWVKIDEFVGVDEQTGTWAFDNAKSKIDNLIIGAQYPKIVYEKEVK